jgi:hypothetical protein
MLLLLPCNTPYASTQGDNNISILKRFLMMYFLVFEHISAFPLTKPNDVVILSSPAKVILQGWR